MTGILVRSLPILACLLILTTCGKDSPTKPKPPEPPPPVTPVATRIEITPSSATLNAVGQTVRLTARVFDQNNNAMVGATVIWSSSDVSVAGVNTQGLMTAVTNGTAVITARSGNARVTANISVSQAAGSIVIEPEEATLMSLGATVQLTATVLDGNGQPVAGAVVTWTSSDEAVTTVNAQGLVTAVGNGVARITATSGSASSGIDVSVMQSAGSIVIAPEEATLMSLGATVQLTATVLDGNGQPVEGVVVMWQSGDESVVTVSAQGLVTSVKNGAARVTATLGGASSGIDVTVMQIAGSIVIAPMEATLMSLGATVQLTATVLDGNGQPVEGVVVMWQSGDDAVATVSAQGLVTAVNNGVARVTARSGSASAGIDVTVLQSAGSIVIAPMEATLMSLGATVQLTVTVLDQNGQPVADATVTWQSSDESVATVSAQGLVTAVNNGVARVTATSGSASSGIDVTVMQSAGSIVIAPEMATLMSLGETVQLEATVLDGNGQPVEGVVVMWQSGDDAVATVSAQGLVTAVNNGVARVTARSGSASAGIDVTVLQSAGSIVIAPMEATLMSLGATAQLTATVLDQNGQPVADATVTWQSGDESVATVNAQGLVTAVGNGVARITATSGSASSGIDVSVMQSAGSIVIAPEEATLMSLGATVQLTATVLDGNGQPVDGAVVRWSSGDESVATVSSQGLVTAVGNGVARITATSGSASSGIDVTVMQIAGSIVIAPEEATLMSLGETVQLTAAVLDQNGQPVDGAVVRWSSGDESVATVSSQGLVTAVGNGVARITATSGSASSGINVSVMQSAGSIVIAPMEATLMSLGATAQLTVTVLDQNGQPVADATVTWQSSDESVATVSAQGLVTAVSNGVARITARSGSVIGSVTVIVETSSIPSNLERDALVAFYKSTNGSDWEIDTNWLSNAPLIDWYGVSVFVIFGNPVTVDGLFLPSNGLSGFLPPELGLLDGVFYLDLSNNELTSSIPAEIGGMSFLGRLNLSNNRLTGSIPTELGQLTGMEHLNLSGNQLTGDIPVELRRLTTLMTLDLSDNRFTGEFPTEFGNMDDLRSLDMENNSLLTGPLPREITRLNLLRYLNLRGTQLCVPRSEDFAAWVGGIADARVTICPEESTDRGILAALYQSTDGEHWINDGNWLSDKPVDQWFGVTADSEGRVVELELNDNNLAGNITGELGNLSFLVNLNLEGNPRLSGPLPRSLVDLSLEKLYLDGTQVCAPADVEFQSWLTSVPDHSSVADCIDLVAQDRNALITLYHATDGPNWTTNNNWLSNAPLDDWHGVTTDNLGRVAYLFLSYGNLAGQLPPELGELTGLRRLNLKDSKLTGGIPPELGQLVYLKQLWLQDNRLMGKIPSEIGQLSKLEQLLLSGNRLTGSIPTELSELTQLRQFNAGANGLEGTLIPELGQLTQLEQLILEGNRFTGVIPPELGQLTKLRKLMLGHNNLTGGLPPELAQLTQLRQLWLGTNQLTGRLDEFEFGRLSELEELNLHDNQFSGSIPPGLGQLSKLTQLLILKNRFSGDIPVELGQLTQLKLLGMEFNQLTGRIPSELGQLVNLKQLWLNNNQLSGELPSEFGNLASLEVLNLSQNRELTGPLPLSLTRLDQKVYLLLNGTQLCVPSDPDFQSWYLSLSFDPGLTACRSSTLMKEKLYLTQAVQSFNRSVPLVENEPALLRVFLATEMQELDRPPVRATFFLDGVEVHTEDIPGGTANVPAAIDESSLVYSANAEVPAQAIRRGLEVVVEIDPEGMLGPESGIDMRIPEAGRMAVDVQAVPPLNLTLVPLVWTENPDNSVVMRTEGLMAEDELFRLTRDILPVHEFDVISREPIYTSTEPVFDNRDPMLLEVEAVRAMDGGQGHYMGVWDAGEQLQGIATLRGFGSVVVLDGRVIAHELGHNMGLFHAPCGVDVLVDLSYPYSDGSIGSWGYDFRSGDLIEPDTPDIMSYCLDDPWISDVHFRRAIRYRANEEVPLLAAATFPQTKSLLLWGGLDGDGSLFLEPSFVVESTPSLPGEDGPYRVDGEDANGNTLFQIDFAMNEFADGETGGGFAFTIPVSMEWSDRLAKITLSGPSEFVEMTRESGPSAALLLDQSTGQVRGILREWPDPGTTVQAARRAVPEPGLEVVVSPGIPDPADW